MPPRVAAHPVRRLLLGAAVAGLLCWPAAAGANLTGAGGAAIPFTDASLQGHLTGAPGCRGGTAGPACQVLADLGAATTPRPAALGHPGAPEDDLAAALTDLAAAPDAAGAAASVHEARAILAGDPLPGRAYSGIPLLNWNAPAKVRTVPAGGDVTVRVVRTPQHTLSDTWMLSFADPTKPYTITYRVSELGGALGGELRPTPLLGDAGAPLGGLHSAVVSLISPSFPTGTTVSSRFTDARGLASGGAEAGRASTQDVTVRMPPPNVTSGILEPGGGPGDSAPMSLAPATDGRRAAAAAELGFSGATDPTTAERDAAIAKLDPGSPERLLWDDLAALPADETSADFLTAAKAIGGQDATLVDQMRSRTVVPAGVGVDTAADVTVVLQNGETYVSRTSVRPASAGTVRVQVVNRDGFDRTIQALALHSRARNLGAEDWGTFKWDAVDGAAGAATLGARGAPGDSRVLDLAVPASTFALAVADPAGGDQAIAVIDVVSGPRYESLRLSPADAALPVHQAFAPNGDLWIALAGTDELVRIRPGSDLAASQMTTHQIPGGAHTPLSTNPPQGPTDVAADERGLVWVTLPAGNGIARVDPAQVADGTQDGIRKYALPACAPDQCGPVFAAAPGELPTRQPLQMDVTYDASGTALVWFTESTVDKIGLLRVAPDGSLLGQSHFACGCHTPLGLALDADGDVWFTEGIDNRIGRLTPDPSDASNVGAAQLRHYKVPSAVPTFDPELAPIVLGPDGKPVPIMTSTPHSVTVDRRGMVWFTEAGTGKIARLDPTRATPNTTDAIDEIALPTTEFGSESTPADLTVDRAGTIFWADEYGDAAGVVETAGPPSAWKARVPMRVTARRSLTDSPILDEAGDLYVVESGANIVTRIGGVGAGQLRPAAPPQVVLDLAADTLELSGLRDADSVDVAVDRGGRTVATATGLALTGGRATVGAGAWSGAPDALSGGDVVRLTPHGPFPAGEIRVQAAQIDAAVSDGAVQGRALVGGKPAPGSVDVAGVDGARGTVDSVTGAYTIPASALGGASARSVGLDVARPGMRVRTIAPVAGASAGGPTGGGGATGAGPAPGPGTPQPGSPTPPAIATPGKPGTAGPAPARTCAKGTWLTHTGARPSTWLLGRTLKELWSCLGAPAKVAGKPGQERLRYPQGLELTLRSSKVEAFSLSARGWTSAPGALHVGARAVAIRQALPTAARQGRTWRAVLVLDATRSIDVRISLDRAGKRVGRIVVRATMNRSLDARGRALLRKAAR